MPEIKIKIGAAVDQSMRTVFKPLVQAAAEARKQIQKEFTGISVGMKTGFTDGGTAAKRVFADTTKASGDMSRELEKQAIQRTKIAKRESDTEWKGYVDAGKQALRATEQLERQRSRGLYQQFREREREAKKSAQAMEGSIGRFAERTSQRATRFFMPNMPIMSMARRAGSEVLQGMGVDASISGLVQRGVGIESAATALSNRGHIQGDTGANGQVVGSTVLQGEARAVGAKTAVNPEELLNAGRAFVGLTGDLDLWRKIMPAVAKQTAALGGNQEEAARAAGEFAAHVGDVPDKEKKIMDLMAVAAGQGKIGGVDFSDFAKYAAKAAAPAAQFQGDKVGNISKLTALAEIAKMHGGASSAAEAFTAISSLTTTLKKPARFKSIQGLLGNKNGQFADNEHTLLKDPQELIKEMIVAAAKGNKDGKSSLDKLAAAVGDSRSLKAVSGLQNTFNEAGGGQKGLDAMNAELKKFSGAMMTPEETSRALAASLDTTKAKAEIFNQKLEAITMGVMAKLAPALEKLEGPALSLAGTLGDIAAWAASNPGAAITAAITAAILRGGVESAFRHGIETIIKDVAGAGPGMGGKTGAPGMLAGAGGIAGAFSSALVIGAIAYAIEQAGELAIDKLANKQLDKQRADAIENGAAGTTENRIGAHAKSGVYTPEDEKQASSIAGDLSHRIHAAEAVGDMDKANGGAPTGIALAIEQALSPQIGAARQDKQHLSELKAEMARVREMLALIHSGTLRVMVTNQVMPAAPVAGKP